jgi:hypothetical protein
MVDHNLFAYTPLSADRLFGIHGTMPYALTDLYADAAEDLVNVLNDLSYTAMIKYHSNNFYISLPSSQYIQKKIYFVKVDDTFNHLNNATLNTFILGQYVAYAL